MKRLLVCISAFVIVISIFYVLMHKGGRDVHTAAETVKKAFEMTGAKTASTEIYVRGRFRHSGVDEEMSLSLLRELVAGIGAGHGDIPAFSPIDTDFANGYEINYIIDENKKIHMTVLGQKEPEAGCILLVSLYDISGEPVPAGYSEAITRVLDRYGIDHEINITVAGFVEGKLDDDETAEMFDRAMKSADALRVEGINDNGLVSISAFSPYISESVRSGGEKVNFSMASRYNSFEDRTYIWIASPVITTEY
ncbi:MAG TPA: YwmB family TATA-box binding protein [Clostridiales bacterium]|nr:YwmB family TATA-box binding protein [Clostridiales bacterium]HPV01680.1 YwmB family TATA-box binding protein [Clostridiales bacterium]